MKNAQRFRNFALFLTISGVVLSPAAFGGTTTWFAPAFAIFAGLCAILWSLAIAAHPSLQPASIRPIAISLCLFGASMIWCLAQTLDVFPAEFLHSSWSDAERNIGLPTDGRLSLNPDASVEGILLLLGYGVVFLLCYQFGREERNALKFLSVVTLSGAVYAVYGIAVHMLDIQTVFWYPRTFEQGNLSSTFPNRNAFASYAVLCLMCCFALIYRRRIRREDLGGTFAHNFVTSVRYLVPRYFWVASCGLLLLVAILMTHSRAGLTVALISMLVFMLCAGRVARMRRAAMAGGTAILAIVSAAVFLGGQETAIRFVKLTSALSERLEIYKLTLKAIADRPLLGTGLATFSDVFPAYRTPSLRPEIVFAHNSYLENMLEMGVPAAVVFYAAFALLFSMFVKSAFSQAPAKIYPALGIGVMTAMSVHAAFDYSIQFPAVAITGSAILGIVSAQSFAPGIGGRTDPHTLGERRR